jgi:hypothetical protein
LRTPERRDSVPARFKKEINMFSSMAALLLVAGSLAAQASPASGLELRRALLSPA